MIEINFKIKNKIEKFNLEDKDALLIMAIQDLTIQIMRLANK